MSIARNLSVSYSHSQLIKYGSPRITTSVPCSAPTKTTFDAHIKQMRKSRIHVCTTIKYFESGWPDTISNHRANTRRHRQRCCKWLNRARFHTICVFYSKMTSLSAARLDLQRTVWTSRRALYQATETVGPLREFFDTQTACCVLQQLVNRAIRRIRNTAENWVTMKTALFSVIYPDEQSSKFLWNVGTLASDYEAPHTWNHSHNHRHETDSRANVQAQVRWKKQSGMPSKAMAWSHLRLGQAVTASTAASRLNHTNCSVHNRKVVLDEGLLDLCS